MAQVACDGTLRGVISPLRLRTESIWACSDLEASLIASSFLLTMANRVRIIEITVWSQYKSCGLAFG